MDVRATQTKVATVTVDIDPKQVIDKLKSNWMMEIHGEQNINNIVVRDGWWVYETHQNNTQFPHVLSMNIRELTHKEEKTLRAFEEMYAQVNLWKKHHG